ncbi:hypothetical protein [Xylella fastidiosa]|uniref:hypothetical protein n=1 Tax=Xylella fastidiosa TaxID=2371 RepID=UPI0012D31D3A|nr:hypothetical protein [Xylella fastidiosa]UIN27836.1 hypothetical protein IUD23_11290 [Xylella fastidiosa subsp. morus]UIT40029.1 hypothetical protein LZ755_05925 [Xylella fastidiosa subsp. morus]UIT44422.1 hypothetical protein LZ758_05645 [Xylella fastidiosa subsp. morus]
MQTKPPPSINNLIDRKDCSSTATLAQAAVIPSHWLRRLWERMTALLVTPG